MSSLPYKAITANVGYRLLFRKQFLEDGEKMEAIINPAEPLEHTPFFSFHSAFLRL